MKLSQLPRFASGIVRNVEPLTADDAIARRLADLGVPADPGQIVTTVGATTGQLGVLYLFDNGVAPYASYAQSFLPQSGSNAANAATANAMATSGTSERRIMAASLTQDS